MVERARERAHIGLTDVQTRIGLDPLRQKAAVQVPGVGCRCSYTAGVTWTSHTSHFERVDMSAVEAVPAMGAKIKAAAERAK